MQWENWRAEFPILSRKTYLNSCSLGALSQRAEARIRQFHSDWHEYGASAWYEIWMGRLAELRGRVAAMFNVPDSQVALGHSTSALLATIASAVDYRGRNKVVVADLDFPTLAYQWLNRPGVELVYVPSDDGATVDPQRFAEVVDERTAVVATSHVFYATGALQDLTALSQIARSKGALFLVDGYQSVGQLPVDLSAGHVDVFVGGPLKWLLGGPGLCYLYVQPDLVKRLTPSVTGWFGARDQFDFDAHHFEFKDDARRFELGTPALHMVHAALGGQEIIDEVTLPAIRQRNQQLAEMTIDLARERGFRIRAAATREQRSAIVMVAVDEPHAAVAQLAGRGIIVDARPGHVRISPHFYNLESEIELVISELGNWRDKA
ncbi:MAG: aminotransferase class V-fold PLP-dependent enzyme [Gemmatimonadota bacterium]